LKSVKPVWQWCGLVAASLVLSLVLEAAAFPAAYLLGAMLTGIAFGIKGSVARVPRIGFLAAQAIIGCLVARTLNPAILHTLAVDWAEMLLVIATTVLASAAVGWLLTRLKVLPGTTAAWGSSPGAAGGMVAMAEEFGADPRLVALMQYLRVTIVVLTASLVTHLLFGAGQQTPAGAAPAGASAAGEALALAETLAIAIGGGALARLFRIPSGGVFLPMFIGAVLQGAGLVTITLPPWLLAAAFMAIGWYVGLRFERETTRYALSALPAMLAAIFGLIALCALSAAMLVWLVGTDPLTAYLATSPGGLDAVAIIALGSQADISFVLALQTARLFIVIITGPFLAKLISRTA
jgi:membrane AbrB-like protein